MDECLKKQNRKIFNFFSIFLDTVKNKFKTRKLAFWGISSTIVLIFITALIIFNIVISILGNKFNLKMDLTKNKAFTLTQQSVNFIKNISKDVEIIILNDEATFSNTDRYFKQANSVLKQYAQKSNKVKLNYIDIIKNPTYLKDKEYANERLTTNSIIVKSQNKYKVLSVNDLFNISYGYYGEQGITSSKAENELTSAILYVTSTNQKKVIFINGYEEEDSFALKELLKKNNYDVRDISILTGKIPHDADCVILFAPQKDYDDAGIENLRKYLENKNSNLIYIANPNLAKTTKLEKLLEDWNIKLKDGIVYETNESKITSGGIFEAICEIADTDYLGKLQNNKTPILMPYCKAIEVLNKDTVKVLLQYSSSSGIIKVGSKSNNFDLKSGICGPNPIAAISERPKNGEGGTVTVFGSFIGLSDKFLEATRISNSAYFGTFLDNVTKKESTGILIEPKSIEKNELSINAAQINMVSFVVMAMIPLLVIAAGILMFLKRRHL